MNQCHNHVLLLLHYSTGWSRALLVCGRGSAVSFVPPRTTYLSVPLPSALGADPAHVTSVSGPHQVLTGRTVTLTCNIAAIPDVTVMWYKDGSPVPSAPSISTTPDTNTQLTIASATPADSGMYQCVVSNEHGDDVGSISLQVRDPRKGP